MSVTAHDLKSMMNKVRRVDPPSPPPNQPPSAPPPAPRTEEPAPQAAAVDDTPVAAESTDIGSILEEIVRDEELMTRILGVLYRAKKKSPNGGAIAIIPMEKELGIARESATFVLNYLKTKRLIETDDKSRNIITVEGVDFLRAELSKL